MLQDLCLGSDLAPHYSSKLTETQKVQSQLWPKQQPAKISEMKVYKMLDVNEE